MAEPTLKCPQCNTEIKLTESLAAPLIEVTRKQFEQKLALKDAEIAKRQAAIDERVEALAKAEASVSDKVAAMLKTEREKIVADEAKKARAAAAFDMELKSKEVKDLQVLLKEREVKLTEAQQAQAEFRRKERELEDAKRELELTVEKRVDEKSEKIRAKALLDAQEGWNVKLLEKQETITSMTRQIEELKRRAEQGSQQLQGEVIELELEATLRMKFPRDTIEPVPKGEFGGDVIHRVLGAQGQVCGTILWESKRTKNWSDGWLTKLRGDQRMAKADVALIISQVVPKGVEAFDLIDGVWVVEPRYAVPVAMILRDHLIAMANTRQAGEGQQSKMELVYNYVNGATFRHRLEAIIEKYNEMRADLEKERKALTRSWSKREKELDGVLNATVGMFGDFRGIIGKSLQEIEGVDFDKMLE